MMRPGAVALMETMSQKDAGQGAEPGMLAPGATYAWRVRVTPPKVERNGAYVILPGAAPAFTVKVTGVPDPLWLTRYPPPGHDPRKIYFPRRPLPPTFLKPAAARPPEEALRAPDAQGVVGADGLRTVYMAKREYALTAGWAYSSPLKPEALVHVPAYFEVTYDAAGRLVKEVEFKDGRRDNWAEYDGQRRIVRHGHYDRHGDVDRATEVTREGGRVVRLQYYGPKMAPADGKVYAYDGRGRRVSEHRYDRNGSLTDYFLFDPPVTRGTTRYRRFTADGKHCGEGETYVD